MLKKLKTCFINKIKNVKGFFYIYGLMPSNLRRAIFGRLNGPSSVGLYGQ